MKDEIKKRLAQIRAGKIPEGYKKGKLGIVPNDWEEIIFSELFTSTSEYTDDLEKYPLYSLTIEDGITAKTERYDRSHLVKKENSYKIVRPNDFAYNPMNIRFGAVARHKGEIPVAVSGYYDIFTTVHDSDLSFMEGFLTSDPMITYYNRVSTGSLVEKQRVHFSDFMSFSIPLPPLEERKKIAEILTMQDKVIELCERKLEQLKRMKKYYLQNMFPKDGEEYPKIRFKGFTEPWEQRKLGEVLEISTHKNGDRYTKEDVLSVSDEFGCVNQIRFQGRSFAGADISNYKIVSTGDIVYTRSPLQAKPFGIIKIVRDEIGVVSPLYIVNKAINGNDAEFIYRVFDLPYKTNNYLSPLVRKGAKNTMNISEDEWLSGDIIVSPIYEEQQTIGAFFKDLDHLITLHQRKCEEEKKKKKALQQLLLTGIVRV